MTTLKVNVNLVNLFFTVKDRDGALIPHLGASNCSVEEDKTPQTLKHFQAVKDQPLTLGILLDPIADKLLICSVFISLVEFNPQVVRAWVVAVVVAREFLQIRFCLRMDRPDEP